MANETSLIEPTNLRAVGIFGTYLTTNVSITLFLVTQIFGSYARGRAADRSSGQGLALAKRQRSILIFSALAAFSLAVTWHYMVSFFRLSYQSWAAGHLAIVANHDRSHNASRGLTSGLNLSAWLKDTQLFREAWETAVETPGRLFWSQPIFFVTTAWSLFIACTAQKQRGGSLRRYGWMYMVLGQLVAISFAMNLFFVAVEAEAGLPESEPEPEPVNPPREDDKPRANTMGVRTRLQAKYETMSTRQHPRVSTPPLSLYAILLLTTFVAIALVPHSVGTKHFLLTLAVPHLLLLIPPILHYILPQSISTDHCSLASVDHHYALLFQMVFLVGMVFQAMTSFDAWLDKNPAKHHHRHASVFAYPFDVGGPDDTGLRAIFRSLLSHPAVSSVGWDSMLCAISFHAWEMFS